MRAIIFANGNLAAPAAVQDDDLIIAADGGAQHCLKHGLLPAYVIGDLDSLSAADLEMLRQSGAQILRYPRRKDYTDLELAIRFAEEKGVEQVLIYAALGMRWDQTLANLLLPTAFPDLKIRLIDGNQELFYIHAGGEAAIQGKPGDTLSLIPLGGDAKGISTQDLDYPLSDGSLAFGSTCGISNVLLGESAKVKLREGLLLCSVIHHGE